MLFNIVLQKSSALLSAMLIMTAAWSIFRLPGASLQMVTFAILASTALCGVSSSKSRLLHCIKLVTGVACLQFLMGVTALYPLLRIILSALLSFFILYTAPDRQTAIITLLAGYLSLFDTPGYQAACNRCFDIMFSGFVVLCVTALGNLFTYAPGNAQAEPSYSVRHAAIITAELTAGFFITQMFRHEQSAWIMLTVLFIHLAKSQDNFLYDLARQRISAALPGILLAGIFLASFCNLNYRWVYITPISGTLSFFMLYLKGDYFIFTLLFMFTLTVFTDWMLGTGHRFHFAEIMLSRTISTVIGAMLLLCGAVFMREELS